MDFNQFAFWMLCGLLTISVSALAWFLNSLISEIHLMRTEMSSLNEAIVKVVTNLDWHGKELNRLDSRLSSIEARYKKPNQTTYPNRRRPNETRT